VSIAADVGAGGFLTAVVVWSGVTWFGVARSALNRCGAEHRARTRARQAQAALTEASLEDDWFSTEDVLGTVEEILTVAEAVWRDGRPGSEPARRDAAYIERWATSVATDIGEGVRLARKPTVDILGVTDRPGESEDRIVLRVRLRCHCAQRATGTGHMVRVDMRWTLGRKYHAWTLLSIDHDPLAPPLLNGPLIPAEWADEGRLREESLVELAHGNESHMTELGQLVGADAPTSRQLTELAQLDGRFDPDLLAMRVRHIVEAWEEASTGSGEPLAAVASSEALAVLLYPRAAGSGPDVRRVLRDAVIEQWAASELLIASVPYSVDITLVVSALSYLVNWPNGTYRSGNAETRHEMSLVWTLALTQSHPAAWHLISSTNPTGERA
jgi:hypothetical protein